MTVNQYVNYLHEYTDDFGHTLFGDHFEYHEGQREPEKAPPELALLKIAKELHKGYDVKLCYRCGTPFLLGKGLTDIYCGEFSCGQVTA